MTGRRVGTKRSHRTLEAASQWLESLQTAAATGVDPGQTLATFVATIGDRWARAIDPTSTYGPLLRWAASRAFFRDSVTYPSE